MHAEQIRFLEHRERVVLSTRARSPPFSTSAAGKQERAHGAIVFAFLPSRIVRERELMFARTDPTDRAHHKTTVRRHIDTKQSVPWSVTFFTARSS